MTTTTALDDHFGVFALTPRPFIDIDALRESFARLSATCHPDKHQGKPAAELAEIEKRYAAVNKAFQILREPKDRLLYLFERENGKKPADIQRIPPGTMDLFVEVGQLCQKIDDHFKAKSTATTALEKAGMMVASLALQDQITTLQGKLAAYREQVDAELIALDVRWVAGEKKYDELETLYRKYSYVWRWQQQLEERLVTLLTD